MQNKLSCPEIVLKNCHRHKHFYKSTGSIKTSLYLQLALFIGGILFVLIPDNGQPAFKLNSSHGPSWWDMPGILLLLIGWAAMTRNVIKNWRLILDFYGKSRILPVLIFYLLGIIAIIFSLKAGNDILLAVSAVISVLANFILVYISYRIK